MLCKYMETVNPHADWVLGYLKAEGGQTRATLTNQDVADFRTEKPPPGCGPVVPPHLLSILPTQDAADQRPRFCLTSRNQRQETGKKPLGPLQIVETQGIEHGHLCKERMTYSGTQRR